MSASFHHDGIVHLDVAMTPLSAVFSHVGQDRGRYIELRFGCDRLQMLEADALNLYVQLGRALRMTVAQRLEESA